MRAYNKDMVNSTYALKEVKILGADFLVTTSLFCEMFFNFGQEVGEDAKEVEVVNLVDFFVPALCIDLFI